MINIGQVPFIIIIQTIIFLIILSVFLLFLLRIKNKQLKKLMPVAKDHVDASSDASTEHYLTAEIKLTQSRFDMFYKEDDLQESEFAEPDWLLLRKNYLDLEKTLLSSAEREDDFWVSIGDKLKSILSSCHLVKRIKLKEVQEDEEDEVKELKSLLKSQYDDFDDLYLKLEGEKSEAEVAELKQKMKDIIRSHTELSHCLYILEDENMFLRDQIQGLLK